MYILDSLWYGNIAPSLRGFQKGSRYEEIIHALDECEIFLEKELSHEGFQQLKDMIDLQSELLDISERDSFIKGFQTGAKIIMDVLGQTYTQFPLLHDMGKTGELPALFHNLTVMAPMGRLRHIKGLPGVITQGHK